MVDSFSVVTEKQNQKKREAKKLGSSGLKNVDNDQSNETPKVNKEIR